MGRGVPKDPLQVPVGHLICLELESPLESPEDPGPSPQVFVPLFAATPNGRGLFESTDRLKPGASLMFN